MRTNNKVGWLSYLQDHLKFGSATETYRDIGEGIYDGLLGICQLFGAMIALVVFVTTPLWIVFYLMYKLIKDYISLERLHDKVINYQVNDFHAQSAFDLLDRRYKQTGLRMYKEGQYDCILAVSDNNHISLTEAKRRLIGDDPEDIDQTERMQMRVDKDLRL